MSCRSIIKFKVKFFTTTVKHLKGKVWTPWLAKFLYSKGLVAWMRGCSAAKREDIANMDLRVVLWLPLHGNTMVRQFRVNNTKYWAVSSEQSVWSNFSTSWKFDQYCVNVVQGKQQIAQRMWLNSWFFVVSPAVLLSYTDYFDPLTLYVQGSSRVLGEGYMQKGPWSSPYKNLGENTEIL